MTIKSKITEITARLIWRVEHERGDRDLEITSDPWSRTHYIKIPIAGPDWRDIEYLHELAHATLAEKHHLLSTAYFIRGTPPEDYEPLRNPVRIASDWYADHLLMQWAPEEEESEIREHADYGYRFAAEAETDIKTRYILGICIAQAVKYLGDNLNGVPHIYRPIIDILLAVDPGKPDVKAKRTLINQLAALTCPQRVHLTREDGFDVWRIKK